MKKGVFIYQKPASLFTGVRTGVGTYGILGLKKGTNLRKQFVAELNNQLAGIAEVVADSTEANLEAIAEQNLDFIICSPGLQKIVKPSKELPPIIYTDLVDFHQTTVGPTIQQIKKLFSS